MTEKLRGERQRWIHFWKEEAKRRQMTNDSHLHMLTNESISEKLDDSKKYNTKW